MGGFLYGMMIPEDGGERLSGFGFQTSKKFLFPFCTVIANPALRGEAISFARRDWFTSEGTRRDKPVGKFVITASVVRARQRFFQVCEKRLKPQLQKHPSL
jgi:hypothetical protein